MLKSFPELGVTLESRLVDDTPLYHFKKTNTPLTIYVTFDFGSIHGSIPGISHFLEHVFFTGTEKFPTKKAFTEYVRSRGWTYNGWTAKHRMLFPLLCNGAGELEPAFDYFDQILNKSSFHDLAIENERGAILDEIRRSDSDADKYIAKTRLQHIFPDNVLQYAVLGDASSVTSITRDDLLRHRYLLLESRRCIVSIGDCSIEDVTHASRIFVQSLSQQKLHDPILYRDITKVDTVATVPFKRSSVDIIYGLTESADPVRTSVLMFLHNLLFSQSGLMIQKLRFEKGLTYSTRSLYTENSYFGFTGGAASCDITKIDSVTTEMIQVMEHILHEHVTKDHLQEYLRERKLKHIRAWETGASWIDTYYMELLMKGESTLFFDDVEQVLEDIDISIVKSIAKEIFNESNRSVVKYKGVI